jgi:quercetin dioxygenase-like cupin family protein/alkylhydroperoxidase/carboxymuconolactone decarboxylase family protein YurZ
MVKKNKDHEVMVSALKLAFSLCLVVVTVVNSIVYGQQKNRDEVFLTPKQEAIVPIAAYAAKGDQVNLKNALEKGLGAGLAVNEIKEILIQLYAYAGFPRSLNAISTFQAVVNERKQKGVTDLEGRTPAEVNYNGQKYQFGKDVQAKLTGRSANSTQGFVPVIDTFLKEHLFADIFGRDNLDYQSREIATISILATIGSAENQLRSHLSVARNTGLTERQLRGIATKLSTVIGLNASHSATRLIDTMYGSVGNSITPSSEQAVVPEPTFSKGNKVSGNNFTGDVWVNRLATINTSNDMAVGNVTFAPKARSNWHLHPLGQILLVTDGVGYYKERGKPIRIIRKGDVIKCTANVAHWHGAARDSFLSHIALGTNSSKGIVIWMEKVTDEEYNSLIPISE